MILASNVTGLTNLSIMQAGLDSLAAVELRNGIAAAFDVQPPVTLTYDHPTLAALADFLVTQLAPAAPEAGFVSSILVRLDDTAGLHLIGPMAAWQMLSRRLQLHSPGMVVIPCFRTAS